MQLKPNNMTTVVIFSKNNWVRANTNPAGFCVNVLAKNMSAKLGGNLYCVCYPDRDLLPRI